MSAAGTYNLIATVVMFVILSATDPLLGMLWIVTVASLVKYI